jgi:hypothetical protein
MSIGQFVLLGNWLIELDFRRKIQLIKEQKILWVLFSLYLLHIVALLWTNNLDYGFKDLRIKVPLLLLPLIIGTSERLKRNEWRSLLSVYIGTLFILSLVSFSKLIGLNGAVLDKRELSIYISHIRYGLNIALGVVFLLFYSSYWKSRFPYRFILATWLTLCLFLFQLYTGLFCLLTLLILRLVQMTFKRTKSIFIKWGIPVVCIGGLVFTYLFIHSIYKDFHKNLNVNYDQTEQLEKFSAGGEEYWHDTKDFQTENGIYIRRYIAWKELERAWGRKSDLAFYGNDRKGQYLSKTLCRYLSSKGLKKDSLGFSQLSDQEIEAIENGIANVYYLKNNALKRRVYETFYELQQYKITGMANGFSLAMRFEFWKTAWQIITKNTWLGVGTGDIKEAFIEQYEADQSLLQEKYRRRAHNQYITFWATFGLLGLSLFLAYLLLPFHLTRPQAIYLAFFLIATLSFVTEDTLETQAGVTFFALFNTLLLVAIPRSPYSQTD